MTRARHNEVIGACLLPLRKALLLAALCAAGSWSATFSQALEATNAPTVYSVRLWQIEDGLPQNSVWAMAQTLDDYLWVGTREGLARFDGVRFTLPDEKAAPELRHGWIMALCAARDGSLWVGVDGAG